MNNFSNSTSSRVYFTNSILIEAQYREGESHYSSRDSQIIKPKKFRERSHFKTNKDNKTEVSHALDKKMSKR